MLEKDYQGFSNKICGSKISDASSEKSSLENNVCDADFIYDNVLEMHPTNGRYSHKGDKQTDQTKYVPPKKMEDFERIAATALTEHFQELNFALLKLHVEFEEILNDAIHLKGSTDSESSISEEGKFLRTKIKIDALNTDIKKRTSGKITEHEGTCHCLCSILTQIKRHKKTSCENCMVLKCAKCGEKPQVQFISNAIKLANELINSIKEILKTTNFEATIIGKETKPVETIPTLLQDDLDAIIKNYKKSQGTHKHIFSEPNKAEVSAISTVKPTNANAMSFDIPQNTSSIISEEKLSSEDCEMKNLKSTKLEDKIEVLKPTQESIKEKDKFNYLLPLDLSNETLEKKNSNVKIDNDTPMHNFNTFHIATENESLPSTPTSGKSLSLDEAFGINELSKYRESNYTNAELDDSVKIDKSINHTNVELDDSTKTGRAITHTNVELGNSAKTNQSINLDTELRDHMIPQKLSKSKLKLQNPNTENNMDIMTVCKLIFEFNLEC